MFEVLLPATDSRVAGLEDEAEAIDGTDGGLADEAGRFAEAAQGGFAGGSSSGGGGEEADGEAGGSSYGRPDKEFGRSFAQLSGTPLGARGLTAPV